MDDVGCLKKAQGRFEFHFEELGMVVRGPYAEWVLQAAAEVIAKSAELSAEGDIAELEMLVDSGEAEPVDLDIARQDRHQRFEPVPQCVVSIGAMEYHWTAAEGRASQDLRDALRRIIDMSKTRGESWLRNEDGVDTTAH
jgi:hypothetical protein